MTSPRTPEEEPGGSGPRPASSEDPGVPPPPQWLNEQQGAGAGSPFLPQPPLFPPFAPPQDATGGDSSSEDATVADEPAGSDVDSDSGSDSDASAAGSDASGPGASGSGASGSGARAQEDSTQQISSQTPPPFPQAAAPPAGAPAEPFPFPQYIPGVPSQQVPSPQPPAPQPSTPSTPEPFPYAQEIPGHTPEAPPAPPAPPWGRTTPPSTPEPFPYAQEIPGQSPPAPPSAPAPAGDAAAASPLPPVAPPPQIEEPWRTTPSGGGSPKRGMSLTMKRILLSAGASAIAAGITIAALIIVPGLGGDEEESTGGARLARSVFPVAAGARTDGHNQEVSSVAAAGSTVVAVGNESGPRGTRGVFLVSPDGGRTYRTAEVRGADGGPPPTGEVPAVVGGSTGGWVAIGSRNGGGAVWLSQNGRTWQRQPDAVGSVFGPNTRVKKVVAAASGFVAFGESSGKGDFTDSVPAVWLSPDGRRWQARVDDQIGLEVRNGKAALVEAASSGDAILLEALITPDKGNAFRRVWHSLDGGNTWTDSRVPVPKGARGLLVGGGLAGFIAIREMRDGDTGYGQVYVSPDGAAWRESGRLNTAGYRFTNHVVADDKGFAAIVSRGNDVVISRSADGAAWRDAGALATQPGRQVRGAALSGNQTVLVGRQPGGGDIDPLLNVWDANGAPVPVDPSRISGAFHSDHSVVGVTATADRAVAVGSAAGDAAVWTSQDGETWRPAQGLGAAFTRPGTQQLTGVTAGRSGWLAVGDDLAGPRRPLVVTSTDGATWQAADSAAAFRGDGGGEPATAAAASGPAGYVIVGTAGQSAATWFSADLKNWERGRSAGDGALESQDGDSRWMLSAAGGQFGYVAVGGVRAEDRNHPSVWSSADGKQWTLQRLPVPAGVTEGHLTHVAAKGNTLVATGVAAAPEGLVWLGYVSADGGKTWRRLQAPGRESKALTTSLTATPKGFAGTAATGAEGAADVVAWTSADGSTWTVDKPGGRGLAGAGDQQITGLAALGNKLIGIGRTATQTDAQPVLWNRPLS